MSAKKFMKRVIKTRHDGYLYEKDLIVHCHRRKNKSRYENNSYASYRHGNFYEEE